MTLYLNHAFCFLIIAMLEQLQVLLDNNYLSHLSCSTILSLASVNHSFLLSLRSFINKSYSFFWPTYPLYPPSNTSSLSYFTIYSPLSVIVTPDVPQDYIFPPYITKLLYTYNINSAPFSLPPNLKELHSSFNLPVDQFPQGLEVLDVNNFDG